MDENLQHLDGSPLSQEEQRLVKEALDNLANGILSGLAGTIGQPVSQEEKGLLKKKLGDLEAGIFDGLAGTIGKPGQNAAVNAVLNDIWKAKLAEFLAKGYKPVQKPPTVSEWLLATKRHPDNVFGRKLMASMLRAHRVPGCRGFPAPYREDRRQFVAHVRALKAKLV
jgi:hypothetical protein